MLSLRASISIVGILIGLGIFLISLLVASEISFVKGASMSQRKLYLGANILPDNLLYPLLSGQDRLRLGLAQPQEKVSLQLAYAERRYQAAAELVERGEYELALVTLQKSCGYLTQAVNTSKDLDGQAELKPYLRHKIEEQVANLKLLRAQMPPAELQALNEMVAETEVLASQI